jgi:CHAT domain-containing protein
MLVLAGANRPVRIDARGLPLNSDSFLTAEEVMGLDLWRTELVVLSACETGLGKVRGGEGVFSLQRAFHVSGSRAVVASLWQIPDKATQFLMRRFYENLWSKKMAKLEALREAQIWMLREGAKQPDLLRGRLQRLPEDGHETKDGRLQPYYWAAFVLSGDWR